MNTRYLTVSVTHLKRDKTQKDACLNRQKDMNLFDALRLMHWEIQVYSIFEFYNINKSGRIGYHLQLLLIIEHIIILSDWLRW